MEDLECITGFKFISVGEISSDCTTPYTIKFDKEFTLGEFIEQILKVRGWGYFEINGKKAEYKNGEMISQNPFLGIYYKRISNCTARGGWGAMDYHITLDEIDEYEFMLQDRIVKIQAINEQYDLEHNSYIAFSGGKDSVVLSHLIDMALPNNQIPRVYANTGVEYRMVVQFVKRERERDNRIVILNQTRNIRKTLEEYGYPFKSKEHAKKVHQYWASGGKITHYLEMYITEDNGRFKAKYKCPNVLKYQFTPSNKLHISHLCCNKLKKDLMHSWEKENDKKINITGMRGEEGGQRANIGCITTRGGQIERFHPLIVVSEEWEEEFIKRNNVELCELYYPPYNFKRTGCKGCPFALTLQEQLLTMKKLLPNEYKQCLHLWKPVYDEYVRLGYRLSKDFYDIQPQYNIFDYLKGDENDAGDE